VTCNQLAALFCSVTRAHALQYRFGTGVGFLQIDTPVAKLLKRDRYARCRTAHEGARPHHAKIAVELFDLRFARHRRATVCAIEQTCLRLSFFLCDRHWTAYAILRRFAWWGRGLAGTEAAT